MSAPTAVAAAMACVSGFLARLTYEAWRDLARSFRRAADS